MFKITRTRLDRCPLTRPLFNCKANQSLDVQVDGKKVTAKSTGAFNGEYADVKVGNKTYTCVILRGKIVAMTKKVKELGTDSVN